MKFFAATAVAAASLAVASAQTLAISNPAVGATWNAGQSGYISWSGNCASMGNASKSVDIQLINGPSTSVRYIATLGTLDCSGSSFAVTIPVPTNITSGEYSLRIQTQPTQSYSQPFTLANPASPATPAATTPSNPLPSTVPDTKPNSGSNIVAGSLTAILAVAVAAIQLL